METILGMSASFSSLFILSFLFHKFHLSLILVLKCLPNPHPFHPNTLYIIVLVQYTFTTMCVFQDPGKETTAASLYILEVKKKCHQRVTLVYLSCSPALPPLLSLCCMVVRSSPFLVGSFLVCFTYKIMKTYIFI